MSFAPGASTVVQCLVRNASCRRICSEEAGVCIGLNSAYCASHRLKNQIFSELFNKVLDLTNFAILRILCLDEGDLMPKTKVIMYKESDGTAPLLDWLDELPDRALDKCRVRIERLEEMGHELRRPEADFLRDGIYELRVGLQHVNYRMLYFFHGRVAVVISHGFTKEDKVPPKEIERALERKRKFEQHPERHTYIEE